MVKIKIPYSFSRQYTNLSWRDILFGLENQLIAPQTAIDMAIEKLSKTGKCLPEEIDLANCSIHEPILELVRRLAISEDTFSDDLQAKWLYLVLAWLFENRHSVSDPLGMVEEIYADFGYPQEIASFVRYMPMVGSDLGSRELNEARLYDYWAEYINNSRNRFACPPKMGGC